jgi:hypothetical protein
VEGNDEDHGDGSKPLDVQSPGLRRNDLPVTYFSLEHTGRLCSCRLHSRMDSVVAGCAQPRWE